jgi:hypothetical protein
MNIISILLVGVDLLLVKRGGWENTSLQQIEMFLDEGRGHLTMEMVKTYLALSQADLEKNHKQASPVDNWRL